MRNLLSWVLTPVHLASFVIILLIFHPVQMVARCFGYPVHKRTVDLLNFCLLSSLRLTGAKISYQCEVPLPDCGPLIIVSNHQSMYDIPLLGWFFRRYHPKYVAKQELARHLPSVSYNLRHGGSVLIDRSNPRQAVPAIQKFADYIESNAFAAVIFPEGTRAKDGVMKSFKAPGFAKLLQKTPSAKIVPVAISGSWELLKNRFRPIPCGVHLRCTVLSVIEPEAKEPKEIISLLESRIRKELGQEKSDQISQESVVSG